MLSSGITIPGVLNCFAIFIRTGTDAETRAMAAQSSSAMIVDTIPMLDRLDCMKRMYNEICTHAGIQTLYPTVSLGVLNATGEEAKTYTSLQRKAAAAKTFVLVPVCSFFTSTSTGMTKIISRTVSMAVKEIHLPVYKAQSERILE